MNGIIITVILMGGLVAGVAVLEKSKLFNRWLERQWWWKEISE